MHYLSVENLSKSFGAKPLFNNISLNVSEGEQDRPHSQKRRGKSTMLNIISGKDTADGGKIWIHKDVKVCFLDQEPQFDLEKTVIENIFDHKHPVIDVVKAYEALMTEEEPDGDILTDVMGKMDELMHGTLRIRSIRYSQAQDRYTHTQGRQTLRWSE
jgi:ATP-binding cassette subfamily F protein uup